MLSAISERQRAQKMRKLCAMLIPVKRVSLNDGPRKRNFHHLQIIKIKTLDADR